jgi:MFS transporter, DHA3 family, macrolide efflux protein
MTQPRNWRVRFFTIWGGQAFSLVGSSLVRFALVWWLTEETGSATVLTSATLVSSLPQIGLAPFTGALVDRWDRRRVMIASDAMIALFTGVLAYLFWLGIAEVWHVYLVLFLRAFGDVFQVPAMRASTSLLVPKDQLARVAGLNDTLHGVVNIVSPPLGALLVATINMQGALAIDLITALLAIGPLLFVPIPQPPVAPDGEQGSTVWQEMVTGFRFVWQWQGLFFMFLVLGGLRFFMAPAFSLLPLMVTEHFGGEALELGWINSAHGFGFVAGGFLLGIWGGFKRRTATAVLGLAGLGLGSLLFGLVPADAFWLAMVAMFLRTLMLPMVRGSVIAIFQIHVPPDLQGRVFNLLLSSLSLMAPVGLALGGPLADAYGVPIIFVITGIGCMGIALIWLLNPSIMQLESEGHPSAQT